MRLATPSRVATPTSGHADGLTAWRDLSGRIWPASASESQLELDREGLVDSARREPVEAEVELPGREADERAEDELVRGMEEPRPLGDDACAHPGPRTDVELGPGVEEPSLPALDLPEPLVLRGER